MIETRVLCLCCGERYDADGDCPNLYESEHSIGRALEVSAYLAVRGCRNPRPLDVRMAVDALDARGRT